VLSGFRLGNLHKSAETRAWIFDDRFFNFNFFVLHFTLWVGFFNLLLHHEEIGFCLFNKIGNQLASLDNQEI
jgi:hypothetical protein